MFSVVHPFLGQDSPPTRRELTIQDFWRNRSNGQLSLCDLNVVRFQFISAEPPGAASFSSDLTSALDPGESRPGGRDGPRQLQVFGEARPIRFLGNANLYILVEKRGPGCMRKCLGARNVRGEIDWRKIHNFSKSLKYERWNFILSN